jgi:hypothetical protein
MEQSGRNRRQPSQRAFLHRMRAPSAAGPFNGGQFPALVLRCKRQAREHALASSSTVQAPHTPWSQPSFVPVRSSSRCV